MAVSLSPTVLGDSPRSSRIQRSQPLRDVLVTHENVTSAPECPQDSSRYASQHSSDMRYASTVFHDSPRTLGSQSCRNDRAMPHV
ncbi:MAG: hypothetical protein IKG22_16095 [Atopobiaceae bacterium]|nr:hypothetical protein [Atopobiaceae bacterium]